MADNKRVPFSLSCKECGASMNFDIVNQNYSCEFCGNTSFSNTKKEVLDAWINESKTRLSENDDEVTRLECPNCGSTVRSKGDSQTLKCFACNSTMVKREFVETEDYPLAIIPFKLTLEEAKTLLSDEVKKGSLKWLPKNQKEKILRNLGNLREVYLPFQVYNGPIDAKARRKHNEKEFNLKTYINQKVVIACDNVDNDLIDRAEPFNMEDLKPFEFLYISGHQAKTQDVNFKGLDINFTKEIEDDMFKFLSKKMGSDNISISVEPHDNSSIPVLLPIFVFHIKEARIVINGQTGKIALKEKKKRKSYKWLMYPAIYTLIAAVILYLASGFDLTLTAAGTLVFSLFILTVYDKFSAKGKYNRMSESKKVYSRLGRKLAQSELSAKPTFEEPVFYEKLGGEVKPVEVSFFPPRLKVAIAFYLLLFIFLPVVIYTIAYPIFAYAGYEAAYYFGNLGSSLITTALWLTITVPTSIMLYFSYIKQGMYDRVYVRPYKSNQRFALLEGSINVFKDMKTLIWLIFKLSKIAFFFIIFALLMSTGFLFESVITGNDSGNTTISSEQVSTEKDPSSKVTVAGTESKTQESSKTQSETQSSENTESTSQTSEKDERLVYKDRFDKAYEDFRLAKGWDDSYVVESNHFADFDNDGRMDAVAIISANNRMSKLLYFDIAEDDYVFKSGKDYDSGSEALYLLESDIIKLKGVAPELFYVRMNNAADVEGFFLYNLSDGKASLLLDNYPYSDAATYLLKDSDSDGIYDSISEHDWGYDSLYYDLKMEYKIENKKIVFAGGELVDKNDGVYPELPEGVVDKYIELTCLRQYNNFNGAYNYIKGLDEMIAELANFDMDPNYTWDKELAENAVLGREPMIFFDASVDGNKALVRTSIFGGFERAATKLGENFLIDYELEKIDGKWIIVAQKARDINQ